MRSIWLWIVVAVVIIGGGYWWWQTQQAPAMAPVDTGASTVVPTTTDTSGTTTVTNAPMTATVTYTSSGFSPDPVTIKQGGTVTFVNKSNGGMLVASNAHPTHTQYSGTSRQQHCPDTAGTAFDQCVAGSTYTFTFQKVGSWNYHNHVNADDGGTINVVQ